MQDPNKPKVLYPLASIPLVGHVLRQAQSVNSSRTIVIVGFGREAVVEYVNGVEPNGEFAIQEQQLGTGHALQQTTDLLRDFDGDVLILYGDVPLLSTKTIENLLAEHRSSGAKATILTAIFEDPTGYGRIVRTQDAKHLRAIIEHRDASAEELQIKEMNSGIYVFDAKTLFSFLDKLQTNNNQAEYYLTDVFKMIVQFYGEDAVALYVTDDPVEVSGINTKDQLLALETFYYSEKGRPE